MRHSNVSDESTRPTAAGENVVERFIHLDRDPVAAALEAQSRISQLELSGVELAIEYLVLAYAHNLAIDVQQVSRALSWLDRSGLELPQDLNCLRDLLAADTKASVGPLLEARVDLDATLSGLPSIPDADARAFLQEVGAWTLLRLFNDHGASHELFNLSHRHWAARNVPARRASTLSGLAAIHERHRDGAASIDMRREALAMLGKDQPFLRSVISYAVAQDAFYSGNDVLAGEMYEQSRLDSEAIGDRVGVAIADAGLARLARNRGDFEDCARLCRLAFPAFDECGSPLMACACRALCANALSQMPEPRFDLAIELLAVAVAGLEDRHPHPMHRVVLEEAAECYENAGLFSDASKMLRRLVSFERQLATEDRRNEIAALRVRFDLERKERDREELRGRLVEQTQTAVAMEKLAMQDALTGAPNRRKILLEAERARRLGDGAAWIAILDIDHFKAFNDRFGHEIGDDVLRQFFALSRAALPDSHLLGRLGGEEWLLCIPGAARQSVASAFDRIRSAVSGARLPAGTQLRFSMGCAQFTGDDAIEGSLSRADKALYRAKNAGRDQWHLDCGP